MADKLVIVANFKAKADKVDLCKGELQKLVPITLKEAGCIQYDLHQDTQDPSKFMFYELWETKPLWEAHIENQHLKDFKAATEGCFEVFEVDQMARI